MSKTAVIYWSGTGNTQAMAEAIADEIRNVGNEVDLLNVSDVTAASAAAYEKLALGCPSMGAEVLEEAEFEPFFTDLEGSLSGKKVALFGSYGWGDGEWMRSWCDRTKDAGADLYQEGLIVNETPDDEGLQSCRDFAKGFAAY